jgi:hypothetical protein
MLKVRSVGIKTTYLISGRAPIAYGKGTNFNILLESDFRPLNTPGPFIVPASIVLFFRVYPGDVFLREAIPVVMTIVGEEFIRPIQPLHVFIPVTLIAAMLIRVMMLGQASVGALYLG